VIGAEEQSRPTSRLETETRALGVDLLFRRSTRRRHVAGSARVLESLWLNHQRLSGAGCESLRVQVFDSNGNYLQRKSPSFVNPQGDLNKRRC
jgi:hypothetical protein